MNSLERKLVVTGGSGLVGSAIERILQRDAAKEDSLTFLSKSKTSFLSSKNFDLRNFGSTREFFLSESPTEVIHLAASVGGLGDQLRHPGKFFLDNMLLNLNVLESARLAGVKKLLSFMSSCIYPDKSEYPLKEMNVHQGPPHPSNFGYAYAKRMLEVQSSAYRKEYGSHYILAIPTNIYGPHDNFSLENGHVLPALIHRCFLAREKGEDFVIWGSGKPLREFVFSDDIAKLSLWAIENYESEEPIFFSSALETSIRETVEIIASAIKFKGKIRFDESKPDGQFRKPSDNSKLKKLYPDFKFTSVEEGIHKTVEWFLAQYPNIRK